MGPGAFSTTPKHKQALDTNTRTQRWYIAPSSKPYTRGHLLGSCTSKTKTVFLAVAYSFVGVMLVRHSAGTLTLYSNMEVGAVAGLMDLAANMETILRGSSKQLCLPQPQANV